MIAPARRAVPVLAAVGLLLAAGCGSEAEVRAKDAAGPTEVTVTPGPDGVQNVRIEAGDDYRFSPSVVHAKVGRIALTLAHTGKGAPHTLYGADVPGLRVPLVRAGESNTIRFTATTPGDYRFVCTIHEAQGETGRLDVSR